MADLFKFLYGKPCRSNYTPVEVCSAAARHVGDHSIGYTPAQYDIKSLRQSGQSCSWYCVVRCRNNIAMADITGFQHIHIRSILDFQSPWLSEKDIQKALFVYLSRYIAPPRNAAARRAQIFSLQPAPSDFLIDFL